MLEQPRVQVPFKTVPVVTQERGSYKTTRVVQDTVPATPSIAPLCIVYFTSTDATQ